MKEFLRATWRWVRWPFYVVAGLFVALVIYRLPVAIDRQQTPEAVAKIHAAKITLADVMGAGLPPAPDQAENDATVAGIDKNNNGIRDDVELAIFKKYPNSAKIRAAELQYAMTEQMYLTHVFNTETWKAVAEESGRAASCMLEAKASRKEVQDFVSDTQMRKDARATAFDFITTHSDSPGKPCDVSL